MLKKMSHFIAFVFILFVIGVSIVEACTCRRQTKCQAYSNADFVFVGRIMKAKENNNVVTHQVKIEEKFLGVKDKSTVKVHTLTGNSCGYQMAENELYLIYAVKDKYSGDLTTGMCTRTNYIAGAAEDLEYLRSIKEKGDVGGTIQGRVTTTPVLGKEYGFYHSKTKRPEGVSTIYAELKNSGEILEAKIEKDGKYKFTGLEKGEYKVYPKLPNGIITFEEASAAVSNEYVYPKFTEVKDYGCKIQNFMVKTNGVISGRVLDVDGLAVKDFNVNLFRLKSEDTNLENGKKFEKDYDAYTDKNGFYVFKGLPPGRYLIGVGIDIHYNIQKNVIAYPTTYYPSSKTKEGSVILSLEKAQVITNRIIHLLPKLKVRQVKAQVEFKNIKLPPNHRFGVDIYVRRDDQTKHQWGGQIEGGKKGNFLFKAYENTEYVIKFKLEKEVENSWFEVTHSSRCIAIPKKGLVKPLKISLLKGKDNCDEDKAFKNLNKNEENK